MQKGSVDMKAIVWLRNSIVLIVLPYHGSIELQLTFCATMQSPRRLQVPRSHAADTVLYLQVPSPSYTSTVLDPSTSNSRYRSLYTGPSNASYSLSKPSRDCTSILKRFYALFLPMCTLSLCLVHAMPPQSTKIEHLPRDASAILRERYLTGTFSVVTQCPLQGFANVDTCFVVRVKYQTAQSIGRRHKICYFLHILAVMLLSSGSQYRGTFWCPVLAVKSRQPVWRSDTPTDKFYGCPIKKWVA